VKRRADDVPGGRRQRRQRDAKKLGGRRRLRRRVSLLRPTAGQLRRSVTESASRTCAVTASVRPDAGGAPRPRRAAVYNWRLVDAAYDRYSSWGWSVRRVRGHAGRAGEWRAGRFFYRANVTPPADYRAWNDRSARSSGTAGAERPPTRSGPGSRVWNERTWRFWSGTRDELLPPVRGDGATIRRSIRT